MVSLQHSRLMNRAKGSDNGTVFHVITGIFCPDCNGKYIEKSRLDEAKIICKSCNHVWKVIK
jgi:predicted Zn finger-like uncharacterized protein